MLIAEAAGCRENLNGALALTLDGALRPPPLRWEIAGRNRMLLRQSGHPVLLARVDDDRGGVTVRHVLGYQSPIPPLRADESRQKPDWLHRFTDHLTFQRHSPLHPGRWLMAMQPKLTPYTWATEFQRSWPSSYVDWCDGCTPVIPLRPLSPEDAPRVKAYRRRAREQTLAPVLLWWASALDGWLVLDGHDRAVAALAEGQEPASIVLSRGNSAQEQTATMAKVTEHQEQVLANTTDPNAPVRQVFINQLAAVAVWTHYDMKRNMAWPGAGRAEEWDVLWDNSNGHGR